MNAIVNRRFTTIDDFMKGRWYKRLSAKNFGPFLPDRSLHFDFDFLKRLDKIRNIVKLDDQVFFSNMLILLSSLKIKNILYIILNQVLMFFRGKKLDNRV